MWLDPIRLIGHRMVLEPLSMRGCRPTMAEPRKTGVRRE